MAATSLALFARLPVGADVERVTEVIGGQTVAWTAMQLGAPSDRTDIDGIQMTGTPYEITVHANFESRRFIRLTRRAHSFSGRSKQARILTAAIS